MNPKHWQHVRAAFAADRPEGRAGPAAGQGERQGPAPAVNAPSPQVDADGATRAAAQGNGVPDLPATRIDSTGTTSLPIGIDAPLAIQPDAPRWGDFLLLEELGRGAFGVVYRAWDPALERDIALKLIDVSRLPAQRGDTLLREGRMLARVRHTNVVTVYSTQRIGAKVGLAMECVRGRTLAHLVAQNGALGAQEAALIGVTLCDALAAVHRVGLVHRDVKASNVMREDGGRIVLMDFGAGHDIEPERTHASIIAGTPAYMSPEVLLGAPATPASDIYSLGVLLFHLVTGQFPVDGASMESLADAHRQGARRTLRDLRPDLPPAFVQAVESALVPARMARVPTALALKQSLAAALKSPFPRGRRLHSDSESRRGKERVSGDLSVQQSVSSALITAAALFGTALLLCTMVGVVTTLEFNAVLGRTGPFASERLWDYPPLGLSALVAPAVHIVLMILFVSGAGLGVRIAGQVVPRLRTQLTAMRRGLSQLLEAFGLTTPSVAGQAICALGVLALCAVTMAFHPLLAVYMTRADTAPAAELALLAPDNKDAHMWLRLALSGVIGVLLAGFRYVQRANRNVMGRHYSSAGLMPIVALGLGVICLQAVSHRLVWKSDFPEVQFDGVQCFVIGDDVEHRLLHCPAHEPPRRRVVTRHDARVAARNHIGSVFAPYTARHTLKSPVDTPQAGVRD